MKPMHETLILRLKGENLEEVADLVATEIPFALMINGRLLVTLVCTPTELDAMARGDRVSHLKKITQWL